jgi:hypothetical protein
VTIRLICNSFATRLSGAFLQFDKTWNNTEEEEAPPHKKRLPRKKRQLVLFLLVFVRKDGVLKEENKGDYDDGEEPAAAA